MSFVRQSIKRISRALGLEIQRFRPPVLLDLFRRLDVDMVFDIGANAGMSAMALRNMGYKGRIVSFEPVSHLFDALERNARGDKLWFVENLALGSTEEKKVINVTGGHGGPSSILEMTETLQLSAPSERVVRQESIAVRRLDSIIDKYYSGNNLFCKIDTQGYERFVLEGCGERLSNIVALKLEMSLVEQYHGEMPHNEIIAYLKHRGFFLHWIENGWANPDTGELHQIDGIFLRDKRASSGH